MGGTTGMCVAAKERVYEHKIIYLPVTEQERSRATHIVSCENRRKDPTDWKKKVGVRNAERERGGGGRSY